MCDATRGLSLPQYEFVIFLAFDAYRESTISYKMKSKTASNGTDFFARQKWPPEELFTHQPHGGLSCSESHVVSMEPSAALRPPVLLPNASGMQPLFSQVKSIASTSR